jgi:hypothetical protein
MDYAGDEMSRYYGYMIVTFTDGTTQRVGGNRDHINEGVLVVSTDRGYADRTDHHYFPLCNIREYHWEEQ